MALLTRLSIELTGVKVTCVEDVAGSIASGLVIASRVPSAIAPTAERPPPMIRVRRPMTRKGSGFFVRAVQA